MLKIYHNCVSEFNVNSNFKGHFEVGKEETAVISTMELLSDIGSSVETMSGDGFFRRSIIGKEHNIQFAGDWKSNILNGKTFRRMEHSDFHFGRKYKPFLLFHILKQTELKKKVVAKVTFPFGLEFLSAVLGTVSAKENYQ